MNLNNLDEFILEDISGDDHPSDFIKRDNYFVLILRLPEVNSEIEIKTYPFLIEGNSVYIYNKESSTLDSFGDVNRLINFLNDKIENLINAIKKYHLNIDNLEDSIYNSRTTSHFMQEWLSYKQDVSLINRLMFHASIAIELFTSHLKKDNSINYNQLAIEDIKEELKRVQDLSKGAIEKLENLYNFYRAKVDEKMNKNMYYLTMLSGIFLPLTLLTGFFGMNTGGLPYAQDPAGTWKVIAWATALEVLFFLPFIMQNFKKIKRHKR